MESNSHSFLTQEFQVSAALIPALYIQAGVSSETLYEWGANTRIPAPTELGYSKLVISNEQIFMIMYGLRQNSR
jgi:hypothetical protein